NETPSSGVKYLGYLPDEEIIKLYKSVDVFLYPSLYEGFGLPVIEAMACGCPVITSNTSSLPEITNDAAILVNPLNVNELAKAIINLIKDDSLKIELSKKGIEQAKKFSWEKSCQELFELVKKIYDNRN
ncbi:MAG: glycosyltransferase family 1 protein, partial [Patescibacteria group bacterium]